MTAPTIRAARLADLDAWACMRHTLWPSADVASHRRDVEKAVSRDGVGNFVAEAEGGELVAFLEVAQRPYANGCDTAPVAFVEGVWVDPRARRGGLGRRMIAAAEAWARARGLSELGSDTELHNLDSQAAHVAWGFAETERVVYFAKRL